MLNVHTLMEIIRMKFQGWYNISVIVWNEDMQMAAIRL